MPLIRSKPQFSPFFPCKCAEVPGGCAQWVSDVLPCAGKAGSAAAAVPEPFLPLSWTRCVSLTWQGRTGVFHVGSGPAQCPWLTVTPVKQELLSRCHPNLAWFHSSAQQLLWLPSFSWVPWPASRNIFQILLIFTPLLSPTCSPMAVWLHFKPGSATWVCFL